jgi:hypothetical protein
MKSENKFYTTETIEVKKFDEDFLHSWCFMLPPDYSNPNRIRLETGGEVPYGGAYFAVRRDMEITTEYLEAIHAAMLDSGDFHKSFDDTFEHVLFVEMDTHFGHPPLDGKMYLTQGIEGHGDNSPRYSEVFQHPFDPAKTK